MNDRNNTELQDAAADAKKKFYVWLAAFLGVVVLGAVLAEVPVLNVLILLSFVFFVWKMLVAGHKYREAKKALNRY